MKHAENKLMYTGIWVCITVAILCQAKYGDAQGNTVIYVDLQNYTYPKGSGFGCSDGASTCEIKFSFHLCFNSLSKMCTDGIAMDSTSYVDGKIGFKETVSISGWNSNDPVLVSMSVHNLIKAGAAIDFLNGTINCPIDANFWTGGLHTLKLKSNMSIDLGIKVFCESGYFGDNCTNPDSTDEYHHVVHKNGSNFAVLNCGCTEGVSKLHIITDDQYYYTPSRLKYQISKFIADNVCPQTAISAGVNLVHVRYRKDDLKVVFTAYCDFRIVGKRMISTLSYLQQLLFVSNTKLKTYFDHDIKRTSLSNSRSKGRFQILFRINKYSNPQNVMYRNDSGVASVQHCEGNGCFPWFYISYENKIYNPLSKASIPTNYLRNCQDMFLDPESSSYGPDIKAINNIAWIDLDSPWNKSSPFIVEVFDRNRDNGREIGAFNFVIPKIQQSHRTYSSFKYVRPHSLSMTNEYNVSINLEIMIWCSNGRYGENCEIDCDLKDRDCNVFKCASSGINKCGGSIPCVDGKCQCGSNNYGLKCRAEIQETSASEWVTHRNTAESDACCVDKASNLCSSKINECEADPCVHGRCSNGIDGYTCQCHTGFTGSNCAHSCLSGFNGSMCDNNINDCVNNGCINGTCVDGINSYTCHCYPGFNDSMCDKNIDDCLNNGCVNGTCVDGINTYTCKCDAGFNGTHCEHNTDDCVNNSCMNGTCVDGINVYACNCSLGFNGSMCDHNIDDCVDNSCVNGTCIDGINDFVCNCLSGFNDSMCDNNIDDCVDNSCVNGTCIDAINDYTCNCSSGFNDSMCDNNIDDCVDNSCVNGTCIDAINEYTCNCSSGFNDSMCDNNIDDCVDNSCVNGTCIDAINEYTCNCSSGFNGSMCDNNIDDCVNNRCVNGSCVDHVHNYTCKCARGFNGRHCEKNIDDCMNNSCINGICIDGINSYTCYCAPDFYGTYCDHNIDDCVDNSCMNGTCIDGINEYTCHCSLGFNGTMCDNNINDCVNNNCINGTCVDGINTYTCNCVSGFNGSMCDNNINDCVNNRCVNGKCIDGINDYTCNCSLGFNGTSCEHNIDDCVNNDCVNGTCIDGINNYTCNCVSGFNGTSCEHNIEDCVNNDCINGTCIDGINDYTCNCLPEYSGRNCDTLLNNCWLNPCNNGKCINVVNGYLCDCPPGYTGHNCETKVSCQHCNGTFYNFGTCHHEGAEVNCECIASLSGVYCIMNIGACTIDYICQKDSACKLVKGSSVCKLTDYQVPMQNDTTLEVDDLTGIATKVEAFLANNNVSCKDMNVTLYKFNDERKLNISAKCGGQNIIRDTLQQYISPVTVQRFVSEIHDASKKMSNNDASNTSFFEEYRIILLGVCIGLSVVLAVLSIAFHKLWRKHRPRKIDQNSNVVTRYQLEIRESHDSDNYIVPGSEVCSR